MLSLKRGIVLLALGAWLLTPLAVIAQTTPEPATDDETACAYTDPVQLTWFYKPPNEPMRERLSNHFDLFVLTKGDELLLQAMRNADEYPILQYVHFDSVHDPCHQAEQPQGTPCSCNQSLLRNNVGWSPDDICMIRDEHPDWFLRDADGNLLYDGDQVMIDPGNPEWQAFWVERIKQSQLEGWHGVFIDNLTTQFGVHSGNFVDLEKYATVDDYRVAVIDFLSYVRDAYFDPQNRLLFANISIYKGDEHDLTFLSYLPYLDGVMDEFWAYSRNDTYDVATWEHRFWRMEQVLNNGKIGMMIAQGQREDFQRQRFGLASYLLLVSPDAYFRYTSDQGFYREIWTYGNYQWKLGEPVDSYTREGDTWSREFTNGKVTVDVANQRSSIELYDTTGACAP